ncbi:uncharacterized protein [Apostichopus japonicus]|uniref:uncharacterized protein n=1 Tax=Stichopus japonicus TaxID=307972 RepID=UPI003AB452A7
MFKTVVYKVKQKITNGEMSIQSAFDNRANEDIITASIFLIDVICGIPITGVFCLGLWKWCRKQGTLKRDLKQSYIPLRGIWCSDSTYQITLHKITSGQGNIAANNDDILLHHFCRGDHYKRVLFCGERGIGKSHLFQNIARRWMNGEILQDYILIYLQLDYVPKGANILEEILTKLRYKISEEAFQTLHNDLTSKKSIVMLDGINNWSRLSITSSSLHNVYKHNLTVEELLDPEVSKYEKMKIWITSDDEELFHEHTTRVKLQGFNKQQMKDFFGIEMHGKMWKILKVVEGIRQRWAAETPLQKMLDNFKKDQNIYDNLDRTISPLIAKLFQSVYLNTNGSTKLKFFNFFEEGKTVTFITQSTNFDILACLLEVGTKDKEEYKLYARKLQMRKLVFRKSTSDYYKQAILLLLTTLNETSVKLDSLEIYDDNPIRLLSYLPKVENPVDFYNPRFSQDPDYTQIANTNKIRIRKIKSSS